MKYMQSRFPPQKRPFHLAPYSFYSRPFPVAPSSMPNQNNRACVIRPQFGAPLAIVVFIRVIYLNNCFRRGWTESTFAFVELFEKAAEGEDRLHGQPAPNTGEQFRKAKVPFSAGQDGVGGQTEPFRHPSEDLVPEQKV